MTIVAKDDDIQIQKLQLGPYGTNAYIVICQKTGDSLVVDAPAEADTLIDRLQGSNPKYILLTHDHMDHVGALDELRSRLSIPLAAHTDDATKLTTAPEVIVGDGDTISLGKLTVEVMHTPGHTLGSLCFKIGRYLLSGDTLFPGGPGKTGSPEAFSQIMKSITEKVLILPDDTPVHAGHGDSTVLKKEKDEIAGFSARTHSPDLCGDVLWLSS